jgi:ligand-binding sensor domain-containing protein
MKSVDNHQKYPLFLLGSMKRIAFLTLFVSWLLPCSCLAQEYSYTHYDVADGLAGSTVYCMAQDKDGFIWAATETGVSRFDGTHFMNFTMSEGLPDIEVLQLFGDAEGRMWMAPFRKSVCYYYKGHIHNQENDPSLSRIHLGENVENFAEDVNGNILIQENSALQLLTPDGKVRQYDSLAGLPIQRSATICLDSSRHFLVQIGDRICRLTGSGVSVMWVLPFGENHPNFIAISPSYVVWRNILFSPSSGKTVRTAPSIYGRLSVILMDDNLLFFNTINGSCEYNIRERVYRHFLPGKPVSRIFKDFDGNLWFSTMGQGIFRLNSDRFHTKTIPGLNSDHSGVSSILRVGRELWVGSAFGQLYRLSLPQLRPVGKLADHIEAANRMLFLDTLGNDRALIGSDNALYEVTLPELKTNQETMTTVKSMSKRPNGNYLVATNLVVEELNPRTWHFVDTFWRERTTAVYSYLDTVYVGTLNGLYRLNGRTSTDFLGENNPFLRTRISVIVRAPDGIFWIASYAAGIVGYRNGRVVAFFNKNNGLTSNICRSLLLHHNALWVGTDHGLNRIELNKPGYPITAYTANDGLGSDIINTIYADSSLIYVGTPAGLSFFDPGKMSEKEGCRLYLLSVMNGGKDRTADTANLILHFDDRSIQFGFAGLSYRSAGNILYRYRMIGLDSGWRTTSQTVLEYPVVPPGDYELQLSALNKFGVSSALLRQRFSVVTPFWLTGWFEVLVVVISALGTWALAIWRIRLIRRRQQEKEQLTKKMLEVERMALQTQMNPHFIFNCLNSIQQFIFDQDIFAANKYISGFSRLIRATLQNSTKSFIPLADEISYLTDFLTLEKLRFKDKMDYIIDVDPALHAGSCIIPPMLVQPFVENSMRHGLRHKQEAKGHIHVSFRKAGNRLEVVIQDNGIGRKKAARYKTSEHIEYQSKGMSLTADRMRMISAKYNDPIETEVFDLEDDSGRAAGTRVVIKFPFFHLTAENESL